MESKVSRRQFLRLAGGAAGAVALAACAPAAAPAGSGETSMSEEPIVIRYAGLDGMGARVEAFMIPWVEDNGYKLERGAFGQQELTDKIMQSVATDTYLADIFQFPSNARALTSSTPTHCRRSRRKCWKRSTLTMCCPAS